MSSHSSRLSCALAVGLLAVLHCGGAWAATKTWSGGGGNNNWTTGANWGGTAPVAGDDLIFPNGAARLANNNDFAPWTVFNSIRFTGGGYTLSGNAVKLSGGVNALNNSVASANEVYVDITFSTAAPTIACASGGTLEMGVQYSSAGKIDNGGMLLTVSSEGTTTINDSIWGSGGLTKRGAGVLELIQLTESNRSYFTGVLSVLAGTVATTGVN